MSNEITIFVGIERLQELHVVVLPVSGYQHSCKNKIMTKLEPVSRNIENCVSWPSESAAGRLVTRKAVLLLTVKLHSLKEHMSYLNPSFWRQPDSYT